MTQTLVNLLAGRVKGYFNMNELVGLYKNTHTHQHYNLVLDDNTLLVFSVGRLRRQTVYYDSVFSGFPADYCVECLI